MSVININGQTPTMDELMAQIAKLEARNAELSKARQTAISLKVSDKGAVSAYGFGRFPVTLYKGQWERMIELVRSGRIETFLAEHASELATKD